MPDPKAKLVAVSLDYMGEDLKVLLKFLWSQAPFTEAKETLFFFFKSGFVFLVCDGVRHWLVLHTHSWDVFYQASCSFTVCQIPN